MPRLKDRPSSKESLFAALSASRASEHDLRIRLRNSAEEHINTIDDLRNKLATAIADKRNLQDQLDTVVARARAAEDAVTALQPSPAPISDADLDRLITIGWPQAPYGGAIAAEARTAVLIELRRRGLLRLPVPKEPLPDIHPYEVFHS